MNRRRVSALILVVLCVLMFGAGSVAAEDSETLLQKGIAYQGAGRYEEALDAYSRAMELDPNNLDIIFRKYEVLELLGRYDEARETNTLIADRRESSREPSVYFYWPELSRNCADTISKAIDRIDKGLYEEALSYLSISRQSCPDEMMLIPCCEAVCSYHLGDYDQALAKYDEAIATSAVNSPNRKFAEIDRKKVLAKMNETDSPSPPTTISGTVGEMTETAPSETPSPAPPATNAPLNPWIAVPAVGGGAVAMYVRSRHMH